MTIEIRREVNPQFEEELRRDFRPIAVLEADFTYRVVGDDGRQRIVHRRQRKIRYVSHDQNRICETVKDLGEATGETPFLIPCEGEVELAQAIELWEWAYRKRRELRERQAQVQPLRDEAWRNALVDLAEEGQRRSVGMSSFGPYQRIQRER